MKLENNLRDYAVTACLLAIAVFPYTASAADGIGSRVLQLPGHRNANPVALSNSQAGNPNPGVHPPNSKPYGLSYGEWSAKWWQWLLKIPTATNPNLDATGAHCAVGQSDHVWFLAGSFGLGILPPSIVRNCTIPPGMSILVPVLNQADGAALIDCGGAAPFDIPCAQFPFNGKIGLEALREEAKLAMDNPALLQLSLDGVALKDVNAYRAQSQVFSFSMPTDNAVSLILSKFGLDPQPAGTFSPAVSDGYWVMFTPLSPGQHTIHFEGVQTGGFATGGITYNLTVAR
jgi:hypothetical protein